MKIFPVRPHFSSDDVVYILKGVRDILEGKSFLSQHKHCEMLEKKFANYVESKYAATCSSGTAALEIILRSLRINDSEVIIPTNTFIADATAVIHSGNVPVFADCGNDMCIDPDSVVGKITKKTGAVIAVHIGGLVSPNIKKLVKICKENNIYLIEDCAHSHGSSFRGKMAGMFGVAGAFSFFSTKVMTCGEGGIITTDRKDIYERAKMLRDHSKVPHPEYVEYHREMGSNWRMTEVHALMALAQLSHLNEFIKWRHKIASIYDIGLKKIDGVSVLKIPDECVTSYYKYIMFLDKGIDRKKVETELREKYDIRVGGMVYDLPLHLQPALKEFADGPLPVAEDLCSRHFVLPIYYGMTDEEAEYVVESFRRVIENGNV